MPTVSLGDRFDRWVVISEVPSPSGRKHKRWLCLCDCGTKRAVLQATLLNGKSASCGCRPRRYSTHCEARDSGHTPEYTCWANIRSRCGNPNNPEYHRYGGRGIVVCERWTKFENFLADMGRRPSEKHSIERKNNDLGYFKDNCRWATRKEQQRNLSTNRLITIDGVTRCVAEWAEVTGINVNTIRVRLHQGMDPVQAVLTVPRASLPTAAPSKRDQ